MNQCRELFTVIMCELMQLPARQAVLLERTLKTTVHIHQAAFRCLSADGKSF
jgi:hypothetical protein